MWLQQKGIVNAKFTGRPAGAFIVVNTSWL